jgi:spore germination protein GerM
VSGAGVAERAEGAIVLLTIVAGLASAGCGNPVDVVPPPAESAEALPPGETPVAESDNQVEVTLYFLTPDGEMLAAERRRIFRTATVNDRARQAIQAILDGPEGRLLRSIPPGTRILEIFVARDGTAFVDLSAEFRWGLETGSSDAVLAVYAVVNTLAQNFEEIRRVKLLLDGEELDSVGGHLDLSRPILPEMSLVDLH